MLPTTPDPLPNAVPDALLAAALAADPSRPLFTQYDDQTGERVELSATTVENWVAKTANLLQESGVESGRTAGVLLPPHWQTAVVLLGCWRVGLSVTDRATGLDVAFSSAERVEAALTAGAEEVWALSLAPLGAPLADVPVGAVDYATEVRGQSDRFTAWEKVDPDGPGLRLDGPEGAPPPDDGTLSLAALGAAGRARATELGLGRNDRLLVAVDDRRPPPSLDWLLAPLAAGASVVLVRHPDPARLDERADTERVTVRLRATD